MPKSNYISNHVFSRIPGVSVPRSVFNRSRRYLTTLNPDYLVPFFHDELLPGDTINIKPQVMLRMSTPRTPIMDNQHVDTFFFVVPIRLLYDNWQKLNGEQANPDDSVDFTVPQLQGQFGTHGIGDYFALPTSTPTLNVSSLFHRAYWLIYNEWFRDQNLIDSVVIDKSDTTKVLSAPNATTNAPTDPWDICAKRAKPHDYFTSALPWPQKGPGVELPLGTLTGPGYFSGTSVTNVSGVYGVGLRQYDAATDGSFDSYAILHSNTDNISTTVGAGSTGDIITSIGVPSNGGGFGGLQPHGFTAGSVTINDLRTAFQLQKLYERDARGGTRYTEILRSHFGVISPDARLQRPEFIGGSSSLFNVTPVLQTSSSDDTSPQGNLAGYGVYHGKGGYCNYSATEHCVVIGIINVWSDITYQQGIGKEFSRETRFDFYLPVNAHLGEQAILNKEIFAQGNASDEGVFGYQERWAEYRYAQSSITGKFRSSDPQSLDFWHLSQDFNTLPALNKSFIEQQMPIERVVAVNTEPAYLCDCYFRVKHARPMPVYSVPGYIDHF